MRAPFRTICCALALHLTFVATASSEEAKPNGFVPPAWKHVPNSEELKAVFPAEAKGRPGKVRLHCVVTTDGLLSNCSVRSETPAGVGFGAAAILLTPSFLFTPAMRNGAPVNADVTIPVNFGESQSEPPGTSDFDRLTMISWFPWVHAPSIHDVQEAYPAEARAGDLRGHVVLRCRFTTADTLQACQTITEAPKNDGFARGAVRLSKAFKGDPAVKDAALSRTYINLAFEFDPPSTWTSVRYVNQPDWVRTLDPTKSQKVFPQEASDAKVTRGRATVDCIIGADGSLQGCSAIAESPPSLGFGAAAILTASALKANLWTRDGEPAAGGHIRLPIALVDDDKADPTGK